jgi:hypothetical protein
MQIRIVPLLRWLIVEPWPVYAALGIPLAAFALCWLLPTPNELSVRLAGFLVTLAGVGLVIHDIHQRRRDAKRPSVWLRAREWLVRFPTFFRRPAPIVGHLGVALDGITFAGSGHVWTKAPEGATVEQRVNVLEQNVLRVDERVSVFERTVRGDLTTLTQRIAQTEAKATAIQVDVAAKLTQLSAGSLDAEAIGVAWVVIGTAFATFPQELGDLVVHLLSTRGLVD